MYLFSCYPNRRKQNHTVRESELLNLLSRITEETNVVIQQIKSAIDTKQQLFEAKQLRSRQRENFKKLLVW